MKTIGIIFGGKSDEHEVSILSASSVLDAIDKSKYNVLPIAINKIGDWYLITEKMDDIISLSDDRINTLIPPDDRNNTLIPGNGTDTNGKRKIGFSEIKGLIDFAFSVIHGPFGEDGSIQGMFEILDIPYAGCGVTSSALSMDKIFTKEVWIEEGLPVCRHRSINDTVPEEEKKNLLGDIAEDLGFPLFVKPANMGSSFGITKVCQMSELEEAVNIAFGFDRRIIIEEGIDGRELEVAVLGNSGVDASVVGEIITSREFYDYKSKYRDGTTELMIPAELPEAVADRIRDLATKAYKSVDGRGFARVDFFLENGTGRILINEINTIPGFTKYSMFPALWNESGIENDRLIERIIELGYERYNAKNNR